jgi:hypothetical protein
MVEMESKPMKEKQAMAAPDTRESRLKEAGL